MKTTLSYASCQIFSTEPLICPLCMATIPPCTAHCCSKPESRTPRKKKGGAA